MIYGLQIISELCFQRVALSGNYEIVAISTDENTFFNDLNDKADIGQHFQKSEKIQQAAPLSHDNQNKY